MTVTVSHDDRGRVLVGNGDRVVMMSAPIHWPTPAQQVNQQVRDRLPDAWWVWAYDVAMAEQEPCEPINPLGAGVVFFLDDDPHVLLVDSEARQRIAQDAYEAAREAILDGIRQEAARMKPAIDAIIEFGR